MKPPVATGFGVWIWASTLFESPRVTGKSNHRPVRSSAGFAHQGLGEVGRAQARVTLLGIRKREETRVRLWEFGEKIRWFKQRPGDGF